MDSLCDNSKAMAEIPKLYGEEIDGFGGKWLVKTTSFIFFSNHFLDFEP